MTKTIDTLIEIALMPLAVWLFWRLHRREMLSVRCDATQTPTECVDTHVHKWAASTNKGVLAVCSVCDTRLLVDAQEPE